MAIAPTAIDSLHGLCGDRALVEAHRAGDPDAFAEIVRDHYMPLLTAARRRLGSMLDAEDAVQETLLRAFRGLDGFGHSGDWRLGAWLGRILANVCTDVGTRQRAAERLTGHLGDDEPAGSDVADLVSDPVALDAVRRALDTLPPGQRRAFVLRVVDDLPYPQVAEQLGITEDNARARVQRARAALRQVLTGTGAVAGSLVAAPLVTGRAARDAVRRMLGRAANRTPTGSPRVASPATVGAVSRASATTAVGPVPAATGPVGSGVQLVGQLASSPIGQMAMAVSSSGSGKGSLVLGLAASLATAGALSVPAATSSPSPGSVTGRSVASRPASDAGGGATTLVPGASSGQASAGAASTGTAPAGATGSSGTASSPADPTAAGQGASTPAWVALAAGAGAGRTSSTSPSSGGSGSETALSPTTDTPGTGDTGAAGAPADGTTTSSATTSGAISLLPPGTCAGVPGFPGVTVPSTMPALTSADMGDLVDTGTVSLPTTVGQAPAFPGAMFSGTTLLGATGTGPGNAVDYVASTCMGQGGSLMAVDLTGATGDEVQLVGTLVGDPQQASTGTSAPATTGGASVTTYLFRGSVQQIGGLFGPSGELPWGLPSTFVAQLQVAEPANTVDLSLAFMQPIDGGGLAGTDTSTSSPSTSSPSTSSPASPSSGPTADPAGLAATDPSTGSDVPPATDTPGSAPADSSTSAS